MNKDMGWSYMSKAKVIKYLDSYSVRGVLVQNPKGGHYI